MTAATTLGTLATVVRSKNAGALLVTLDVIFEDADSYRRVWSSGVLAPARIAALYRLSHNQVAVHPAPSLHAVKITLPRLVASGAPGDGDVYGAQQHAPLLQLEIP